MIVPKGHGLARGPGSSRWYGVIRVTTREGLDPVSDNSAKRTLIVPKARFSLLYVKNLVDNTNTVFHDSILNPNHIPYDKGTHNARYSSKSRFQQACNVRRYRYSATRTLLLDG